MNIIKKTAVMFKIKTCKKSTKNASALSIMQDAKLDNDDFI